MEIGKMMHDIKHFDLVKIPFLCSQHAS